MAKDLPQNISKIADIYLNCNDQCDACLLNTMIDEEGSNLCGEVGFLVIEFDKVIDTQPSVN